MLWLLLATPLFVALAVISYVRSTKSRVQGQESAKQVPVVKEQGPSALPCTPAMEKAPAPILQLKARLAEAFAAEKAAGFKLGSGQAPESAARLDAAVRNLMQSYLAAGNEDWRDYVQFNDVHYVRNLVFTCEDFEMMVICWRYGQGSRVHNHADSHCWLTVLEGCVHELLYKMPEAGSESSAPAELPELPGVLAASAPCPRLQHIGTSELAPGETGYINDSRALHAVRVPEHCAGQGAVTLHIYSPPITRVKLYEPDNNRIVQRKPGFFTVGLGEERRKARAATAAGAGVEGTPLMYEI